MADEKQQTEEQPKEDVNKESESAFEVPDAPDVQQTDKYTLPLNNDKKESSMHGMGKTMLIAGIAVLIAILGVGLVWLTHDDPVADEESAQEQVEQVAPLGAAATFIEGVAEMHSGDENWTEIESSVTLNEGDTVRTGSSSRLVITIDDGSAVRLNSNSEATLTTMNSQTVLVENQSGEVYTRVVASDSREFNVSVGNDSYTALGTAYKTSNTPELKGVDVYHSSVQSGDVMVEEGKAYFTEHPDKKKENTVSDINLDGLKDDEFLKWNAELDKGETDFADKLGVLEGIDKEDEDNEDEQPSTDPSPSPSSGITASASKTNSGVKVTWDVSGINTSDGFKVVYDKSSSAPLYGTHASHYVGGSDARSAFVELTDGKTYNVRVCAYRPDQGSCDSYSNTVQVTAPVVQKEPVVGGAVSAELNGDVLSWTFAGTAPHGFKIVANSAGSPTYPNDSVSFTSSTSKDLSKVSDLTSGTWKIRVCKWTNNTQAQQCVNYSNEVSYVVP